MKPWEEYQQQQPAGPWTEYQSAPTSAKDKFLNSLPPDRRAAAEAYQQGNSEQVTLDQERDANSITNAVANISGGLFKGASQIGSTLLWPVDKLKDAVNGTKGSNQQRRQAVTDVLGNYTDTNSTAFSGGKLGAEVAGTMGVGGVLAKGVQGISQAPRAVQLANALRTGGFSLGTPAATTKLGLAADTGVRMAGGGLSGGAMAGMVNPGDAGTGALIGGALPPAAKIAGATGNAISSGVKSSAERLMQSAIKPTIQQLKSGDSAIAVKTLLENGINPNAAGVDKLKFMIDSTNDEIAKAIAGSNATISRKNVINRLSDVRGKFGSQVNPESDLSAIQKVGEEFTAHPYFKSLEKQGPMLEEALKTASLGKVQALQAAGKLKTFAAQQKSLARGGGIKLSPSQPENQLYMNVGATGKEVVSPSAYPVSGQPRIPERYTHNIDRVPEGMSGYDDAMTAYATRKTDEEVAKKALEKWRSSLGDMPVQLAQDLKRGTYKVLSKKYGQLGNAETEAQKALARGLKEEINTAVPGVQALNQREADLIKTLNVTERRTLMELNKNPVGLAALAGNPAGFAAFMADKSALFKSMVARTLNQSASIPGSVGLLSGPLANPALRSGLLASEASP